MKIYRTIKRVALILLLAAIGLLIYYFVWFFIDYDAIVSEALASQSYSKLWVVKISTFIDYLSCCFFTTIVSVLYWRSKEKTEKERDRFRLQALENQLSPHFVFNNFSILADLIETNPKKASAYLMNLSKVYRYTLSHLDHATVGLQDELGFLNQYITLLKERFGENIQVNIASNVTGLQGSIPPATLQVLLENAIKHNEHTKAHPLIIDIIGDDEGISVINKKRKLLTNNSLSIGQNNIKERYRLLTKKKVVFQDSDEYYSVTIPLIHVK